MSGGRKTYHECSCPNCGRPSLDNGRNAFNKVAAIGDKKARCKVCGRFLHEEANIKKPE